MAEYTGVQQDLDTEGMAAESKSEPAPATTRTAISGSSDLTAASDSEWNPFAASKLDRDGELADDVAPRPVGTGSWPGEPEHGPRGTREAVDENRPADITTSVPNDFAGERYAPRPQDRGNVIVPDDRLQWDTAGEELAEDQDDQVPRVEQGAQP